MWTDYADENLVVRTKQVTFTVASPCTVAAARYTVKPYSSTKGTNPGRGSVQKTGPVQTKGLRKAVVYCTYQPVVPVYELF